VPTTKKLGANLKNHLGMLKYKKAIKNFIVEGGGNSTFSTKHRGRLAKPYKPVQGNQVVSTVGSNLHLVRNIQVHPQPLTNHICQLCHCCVGVFDHLNAITIRSHTTSMVC
jgi:hypothetical protein